MENNFWEQNAQAWAEVISSQTLASRKVTTPAILQAIAELKPQSLLDVGCGEGFLATPIQAQKIHYHGIDGSRNLIQIAEQNHGPLFSQVSYDQIERGQWRSNEKWDVILFNFALFDEEVFTLLKNISEFLAPKGHLLIQTLHPANSPQTGWQKEDFKAMSVPFSGTMPWYARSLSEWQDQFTKASLQIEQTREPSLDGKPLSAIFQLRSL